MLSAIQTREFERLYHDFRPKVDTYLSALLRNTADAEDARQDVFLSIWRYFGQMTIHTSANALIMKMATNTAFQMLRKPDRWRRVAWPHDKTEDVSSQRRDNTEELLATRAGLEVASPEDTLLRQEMRELAGPVVLAALERLPQKQRTALRLRHLNEHTVEEIAFELYGLVDEKTTNRVHQLLCQGKKNLRVRVLAATDLLGVQVDVPAQKRVDNQRETP